MNSTGDHRPNDIYAPQCHPRSRVGNLDTSLGGSEWPVCFSCFLDDLAAFDCRGYTSLADLLESGDRWDAPGIHLTVWMADPFSCECPACGAHRRVASGELEICGDRLVCRQCVADDHATPTAIRPHRRDDLAPRRASRPPAWRAMNWRPRAR